ncbi:heme-binding protein [Mycobacterium deserti]|uniref:Heme-binding protein n=1 Tax=Mycobacterium deserti TaxID=2978347 RepID=A0ABT2MBI5_9MYCO|nr:heme-binding protein [Mycobacterium deserti]MCT7659306.1 heme-binding protein [Mycobacterium deserti]
MKKSTTAIRRGLLGAFATCAVGGVAATTIALPSAGAQPGCTASAFSHTASGVLASAGAWLDAHPGANDVLTKAGMQGAGAEQSVRDYFVARPQEYQELRGIAAPLVDLQRNCNTAIQPMQIAALYQALSSGGVG